MVPVTVVAMMVGCFACMPIARSNGNSMKPPARCVLHMIARDTAARIAVPQLARSRNPKKK